MARKKEYRFKNTISGRYGILAVLLGLALFGAGPIRTQAAQETSELIYESPVFTDGGEGYRPAETMEKNGKTYELVSTRIKRAKKEGILTFASAAVPYSLEADEMPPETTRITMIQEGTGASFEREVPLLEIKEIETIWTEDFTFSVVVTGYGADIFYLGETEISGETELSELGSELLAYLGLPETCYRVDQVEWEGEPYEQDGVLCRNAVASGAKRIRNVEARYGGQVMTPEIEGKQYIGVYKELVTETDAPIPEPEPETETEPPETEAEQPEEEARPHPVLQVKTASLGEQILQWIRQHMTVVTFGGLFFLGLIALAALLFLSRGRSGRLH